METKKTNFSVAQLARTPAASSGSKLHQHRPSAILTADGLAVTSTPPIAALRKEEEERVKVFVRIRPSHPHETPNSLKLHPNASSLVLNRGHDGNSFPSEFSFDKVLGPSASQADVYEIAAKPAVSDVLRGYNATLLAYGMTGAGKTHTLGSIQPDAVGIIPRALGEIFDSVTADQAHMYTITLSYLQIYCEQLQDLLCPETGDNLQIREGPAGVYVADLKQVEVTSLEECLQLLQLGARNRTVAFTALNAHSSRSHAVVIATVVRRPLLMQAGRPAKVHVGKLFMVDLAGSERLKKSKSTGQRASEARAINLSLTTLGMCVSARASGAAAHIPFRDSKLTRLLQESLGGNARTSLVVAICDAAEHVEETFQSLQFGSRAMRVITRAKVNEHAETDGEGLQGVGIPGPCSPLTSRTSTLVQSLLEKESELEAVQAQLRAHQDQSRQVVEALKQEHAHIAERAAALAAQHSAQQAQQEALHRAVQEAEERAMVLESRWRQEKAAMEEEMASLKADALRNEKEAEAVHQLLESERFAMQKRIEAAEEAVKTRENQILASLEATRQQDAAKYAAELETSVASAVSEAAQKWAEEKQRLQEQFTLQLTDATSREALKTEDAMKLCHELTEQVKVSAAEGAAQRAVAAAELAAAQQQWAADKENLEKQHKEYVAKISDSESKKVSEVLKECQFLQEKLEKAAGEATAQREVAAAALLEAQREWKEEKELLQRQYTAEKAAKIAEEATKIKASREECASLRTQLTEAVAAAEAERQAAAVKLKEMESSWAARQRSIETISDEREHKLKEEISAKEAEVVKLKDAVHRGQLELVETRCSLAHVEKKLQARDEKFSELLSRAEILKEQCLQARDLAVAAQTRAVKAERARAKLVASLSRDMRLNHAARIIQRAFRKYRVHALQLQRSQGYEQLSQARMALGSLAQQHADLEARRHSNLALTGQTLVVESLGAMQELVETLVAEFLLPAKDLKAVQRLRAKAPGGGMAGSHHSRRSSTEGTSNRADGAKGRLLSGVGNGSNTGMMDEYRTSKHDRFPPLPPSSENKLIGAVKASHKQQQPGSDRGISTARGEA